MVSQLTVQLAEAEGKNQTNIGYEQMHGRKQN